MMVPVPCIEQNLVLLQEFLQKNTMLCTRIVIAILSIQVPVMLLGNKHDESCIGDC